MNGTHASFFSGAGGVDLGLERAGWRTVSHSEIDPYANAVLASRWPGVPNLGSIVDVAGHEWAEDVGRPRAASGDRLDGDHPDPIRLRAADGMAWTRADLWSGGFPCQDLSVAGKRRGLAGSRSGLAFAFLDLVERHRPPAVLLENVPGLLSSHRGRDLGALLGRLGELGYGWAYRVLDARFFGVPQRRRRVFIVALHARTGLGADGAAEVLAVGARCGGHLAARGAAGAGAAAGAVRSSDGARGDDAIGSLSVGGHVGIQPNGQDAWTGQLVVPHLASALTASAGHHGYSSPRGDGTDTLVMAPAFSKRPGQQIATRDDGLSYSLTSGEPPRVLSVSENQRAEVRLTEVARQLTTGGGKPGQGYPTAMIGSGVRRLTPVECERLMGWPDGWTIPDEWRGKRYDGSDLLPEGLDSHRYRLCGNGVVAPVAEWIGRRLAAVMAMEAAA